MTNLQDTEDKKDSHNLVPRGYIYNKKTASEIHTLILESYKKGWATVQVAIELGINESTYYEWVKTYPEFKKVHQLGRSISLGWWWEQARIGIKNKCFQPKLWWMSVSNQFREIFWEGHRPILKELQKCPDSLDGCKLTIEAMAAGKISAEEALKISQIFSNIALVKEKGELELRLQEIEKNVGKKK